MTAALFAIWLVFCLIAWLTADLIDFARMGGGL
jgi:hypothetical protein